MAWNAVQPGLHMDAGMERIAVGDWTAALHPRDPASRAFGCSNQPARRLPQAISTIARSNLIDGDRSIDRRGPWGLEFWKVSSGSVYTTGFDILLTLLYQKPTGTPARQAVVLPAVHARGDRSRMSASWKKMQAGLPLVVLLAGGSLFLAKVRTHASRACTCGPYIHDRPTSSNQSI